MRQTLYETKILKYSYSGYFNESSVNNIIARHGRDGFQLCGSVKLDGLIYFYLQREIDYFEGVANATYPSIEVIY
jgi:hypothetical protein